MVTRYDVIELKADVSSEGWIRDKPVVTRVGIFEYKTVTGKVVKEFRSDEEVFKADSLNTLAGVPVTDGHNGIITSNNATGIIGTVLSPGVKADENVVADVIIHDAKKLGKKRELSLGYVCDINNTPGEWNGQRFDCMQVNIRYNHLAVVNKGRAGNARLRLDSSDAVSFDFEREQDMPDNNPNKLVVIRLDNIDYHADPEVINAYTKAQNDLVALQKRFDTLEAERDSLNTKLVDANKLVDAVKAGARSEVKARLELEALATKNGVKFDQEDTDRVVKEKVLTKLNSSIKFDGKSDDYVDSAFDIAMTYEKDKSKKVTSQLTRIVKTDGNTDDVPAAVSSRELMLRRIRGEKIEDKTAA
jgi:uncharacterized protein